MYAVYLVTPVRIYVRINHVIVCPHYNHLFLVFHHLQKASLNLEKIEAHANHACYFALEISIYQILTIMA